MCDVGLQCGLYLESVKIVSTYRVLEDDRKLLGQRQRTCFLTVQRTAVSTSIFTHGSPCQNSEMGQIEPTHADSGEDPETQGSVTSFRNYLTLGFK